MVGPSEKLIEQAILMALNKTGAFAFKVKDQALHKEGRYFKPGKFCIRGVSDIICFKHGRVFFLEVKTEKGRQSDYQKAFQKKCDEHSVFYAVVRSVDEALAAVNSQLENAAISGS